MRADDIFLVDLCRDIPLLQHMGLSQLSYDYPSLSIHAKLMPNINDKGTGFGGSIATLMTVSGWSLLTRMLEERGLTCDVMVHRSSFEYLMPVHGSFFARAQVDMPDEVSHFWQKLENKYRASMDLKVELYEVGAEHPSCVMLGRYVAMIKDG